MNLTKIALVAYCLLAGMGFFFVPQQYQPLAVIIQVPLIVFVTVILFKNTQNIMVPEKSNLLECFSEINKQLEDGQDAIKELERIRGILTINFTNDPYRINQRVIVWKSTADTKGLTDYQIVLQAVEHLVEMLPEEGEKNILK